MLWRWKSIKQGGIMGVHDGQEVIGNKIWAGGYFGPNGAVSLAYKKHEEGRNLTGKERTALHLMLASTLYSALTHCVAQLVRGFRTGKFLYEFISYGWSTVKGLHKVLSSILQIDVHRELDASQKEVLIAFLLVCRYTRLLKFFRYRKLAIKLGEEITSTSEGSCSRETYLLATARLSTLWLYSNHKECRAVVAKAVSDRVTRQGENHVSYKTVNRLARLIGDKKNARFAAIKAESPDIKMKTGLE